MKYKKFIFIAAVLLSAAFAIAVKNTLAIDQTAISISPLTFDLSANTGDTLIDELIVRNSGKETVNISVESQDFVASGEEGDIALSEEKTTYSLSSWIKIDNGTFQLTGRQQKKVKFSINIPSNAEPGGHYASVYAYLRPSTEADTGAYIGQKIGSLVLLKVAGAVKEEATIDTFKTVKSWYEKGPVEFDVRIKNTGNVHIKPKGMIAVTNIWGNKVVDIPVDQKNVLPGSTRHMSAIWQDIPKFGKYTATLLSYYGEDNKQITEATTFWIIPWKAIIIWSVIIIIIVTAAYLGRHRLRAAFKALAGHKH